MRLLLLEDDPLLGEGLSAYLQAEGHLVEWFTCLAQVRALTQEPYDVLLVDWNLPDGSGLEWIAALRRRGNVTPALVLSARDLLRERIQGLDSGADDYLVKPFAPEELAARVRALARRTSGLAGHHRKMGEVRIDLTARSARRQELPVELTAREWTLLEALVNRQGHLVAKADLEALMHGLDGDLSSNAVEVHVSHLRRKLGRGLIETVRGLGYRIPG